MPAYPKQKQTGIKKNKKPTAAKQRKKLIKDLDDLVREICRKRDKGKPCGRCGKPMDDTWQLSHYIGRRHYALRWDLRNVAMQHAGCNLRHNVDPLPYTLWMIKEYGNEVLEELEKIKNDHVKYSLIDLQQIYKDLHEKI